MGRSYFGFRVKSNPISDQRFCSFIRKTHAVATSQTIQSLQNRPILLPLHRQMEKGGTRIPRTEKIAH